MNDNTIIACIMTMNSEKYIEGALKSLSRVSDNIVVVDGGSTDFTLEIATKYTDEIITNKWTGNHSQQRNVYLNYLRKTYHKGWCFVLDSDEVIELDKVSILKNSINNGKGRFFWFPRKWLVGISPVRYLVSEPHFPDWQLRLFYIDCELFKSPLSGIIERGLSSLKIGNKIEYSNPIHESLIGRNRRTRSWGIPYVKIFSRKVPKFSVWHLDLLLNNKAERKNKIMKYENRAIGSGFSEFYLPEGNLSNLVYKEENNIQLPLSNELMDLVKDNDFYWSKLLQNDS